MNTLHITVNQKTATYLKRDGDIVCGNSDYQIQFIFDDEWEEYPTKTARFICKGNYLDVTFTGNTCQVPIIVDASHVLVGVYAGELQTTTSARIECKRSILCGGDTPRPDFNEAVNNAVAEVRGIAENAKVIADTAKNTANTAKATAETAHTTANAAKTTVNSAKTIAENAHTTANAAKATADAAQDTAENALTTAGTAQDTADTAQATAENALTTAGTAQDTADTANTTANSAKATADTAKTIAEIARASATTANNALKNISTIPTSIIDKIFNGTYGEITFYVDDVAYTALPNMTWGEFIQSDYNPKTDYGSSIFYGAPDVVESILTDRVVKHYEGAHENEWLTVYISDPIFQDGVYRSKS